ncbi:unnamed protein product [Orchesella dallaii]|uniref:Rab-GAP TBC domain-containing protein n=1 Tax=Orchesella dallaii TaxID=48710 RepID=A0ABP1PMK9_9HEXA
MSSPEEETANTISSRESSFFSLTSGNSVYFSAKDSLNASEDGGGEKSSRSPDSTPVAQRKHQLNFTSSLGDGEDESSITGSDVPSAASSATLEEAESMTSFSDAGDYCSNGNGSMDDLNPIKRSPSTSSVEVRKGISRLCSTIANSDSFDMSKKKEIEEALASKDLRSLRKLAMSTGGLLSNGLREHTWSLLLGISSKELSKKLDTNFKMEYPDVTEQVQNLVRLDVARVLKRFPPGLSDPQQDHLQTVLSNLIYAVLQKNPQAYYYQGFHDISLTFLLVASVESNPYLAFMCLNKMIETNLGPHMEKTMDTTHEMIHTIYAIIEQENEKLYRKIVIEAKCPVAFCLPWVLTWFSHTLPDDSDVFRLYDYMLGSQKSTNPPHLIPIFVSAALVLRNSRQILQDKSLTDIASMHQALAKLPSELKSLEPWLEESTELMREYRGKETSLMIRGRKIKDLQHNLWNDETNNNQRRRAPVRRDNLLIYTSRLLFVRHRWTTISLLVMMTAYFLQSRYRRPIFQIELIRNAVDNYAPTPMRRFLQFVIEDEQSD